MQLPLAGDGVEGRSVKANPEFIKNLYPESQASGTSNIVLAPSPGVSAFIDLPNGPIRALDTVNGTLYAVAAEKLYQISSAGASTELDTIMGSALPQTAVIGDQLVIAAGTVYVYDQSAGTVSTVTMPNSIQSSSCAFIGQYIAYMEDSSGRFFISATGDATSVSAADFATAESFPDNLTSLHRFKGNLWLLGLESSEVWGVTTSSFPLDRIPGGAFEVGCAARMSPASNQNYLCWLSNQNSVYASSGGAPKRISNPNISYQLSLINVKSDAIGYMYSEDEHEFYVLTFPAANKTFVYDFKEQWWHQRTSENSGYGRHLSNCYKFAYGKHFVGDYSSGKVHQMAIDYGDENGDRIIREWVTPAIKSEGKNIQYRQLELLAQTGVTPVTASEDDTVQMRYSDTGADWSDWTAQSIGAQGERYTRLKWNGLGSARERNYHFRTATKGIPRFIELYADVGRANA